MNDETMNSKTSTLVSVVIPCYNHQRFVRESIQSVIDQTHHNIELIVVNDGSTDNSHSEISRMITHCEERFKRFIYIKKENEGLPRTLNLGMEKSHGEFISCLSSDDIILPTKIENQLRAFEGLDDSVAAVFGNAHFMDENSCQIYLAKNGAEKPTPSKGFYSNFVEFNCRKRNDLRDPQSFGTYISLLKENYIPAMSSLIRRKCLFEVGLFDDDLIFEDWSMWLKLSRRWKIHYIPEIVAYYRLHQTNMMKSSRVAMVVDGARILLRERSFCQERDLHRPWEYKYTRSLLRLLHLRRWSQFWTFVKEIGKWRFLRLSTYIVAGELRRIIRGCVR